MTEECWSFGQERSSRNGAHDAGTEEAHDGEGTSISEGRAALPPGRVHPGRCPRVLSPQVPKSCPYHKNGTPMWKRRTIRSSGSSWGMTGMTAKLKLIW
jgi:hypothetical protein